MQRHTLASVLSLLCIATAPAFAEVMDKEPAIQQVWLRAFAMAAVGFALCRLWAWLAILTLPFAYGLIDAVQDASLGPAILSEAGAGYVLQAYLAFGLAVLCQVLGVLRSIQERRR